MSSIRNYRDLTVWQRAVDAAVSIYGLTSTFPADERFGITSQMRRASVSISSNIAEGSGRATTPDLLRFLSQSRGSVKETESLVIVSERLDFTTQSRTSVALEQLDQVSRLLSGLRKSLLLKV